MWPHLQPAVSAFLGVTCSGGIEIGKREKKRREEKEEAKREKERKRGKREDPGGGGLGVS